MRGSPHFIFIAVLACLAIFFGVFILFTDQQVLGIAAALVCLGIAQIVMMATAAMRQSQFDKDMLFLSRGQQISDQKYHETFVASDLFDTEVAELKRRAQRLESDMQEARTAANSQYQELNERYETAVANAPHYSQPEAQAPASAAKEQLNFLLQPIIDLSTNVTAHYRAQFSITASNGVEIDYQKLILNADRGGLRASLDVHVTGQAIPLLRRLRVKNPGMRMFIPVGAATLMSERSLGVITAALNEARDVASGIVFELTHDALGRLNETGIAGLASIARIGATMALMDAAVGGLDLASLRKLGVKFIGINASTVDSGFGVASSWHEFVQLARGLQFQVMLTEVSNSKQAAASAQIARLVSGTFFAPPRRVKMNVGLGSRLDLYAAA